MAIPGIDPAHIPAHVAIVMDGNGRWAQRRGLKRTEGHAAGEEALFDTVEGALELGVRWLTVYAFSTENWRRPTDEVRFLMGFNESLLVRRRDELHDRDVRMRFIGRRLAGAQAPAAPHGRVGGADRAQQDDDAHHRLQLRRAGRAGRRHRRDDP
ncbi:MAG: polyprenyl diphosphate synthase [Acidimicrobiales bacterium]